MLGRDIIDTNQIINFNKKYSSKLFEFYKVNLIAQNKCLKLLSYTNYNNINNSIY